MYGVSNRSGCFYTFHKYSNIHSQFAFVCYSENTFGYRKCYIEEGQCRVAPTSSLSITGVKHPRAGLVLRWVTSENMRQAQRLIVTPNAVGAYLSGCKGLA